MQWLLKEGGARIDEKDKDGNTALLLAAANGHLPVVQWLLKEGGARIDEKNNMAIPRCCWQPADGHLPVVQWLLKEGGARIDEKNNDGYDRVAVGSRERPFTGGAVVIEGRWCAHR